MRVTPCITASLVLIGCKTQATSIEKPSSPTITVVREKRVAVPSHVLAITDDDGPIATTSTAAPAQPLAPSRADADSPHADIALSDIEGATTKPVSATTTAVPESDIQAETPSAILDAPITGIDSTHVESELVKLITENAVPEVGAAAESFGSHTEAVQELTEIMTEIESFKTVPKRRAESRSAESQPRPVAVLGRIETVEAAAQALFDSEGPLDEIKDEGITRVGGLERAPMYVDFSSGTEVLKRRVRRFNELNDLCRQLAEAKAVDCSLTGGIEILGLGALELRPLKSVELTEVFYLVEDRNLIVKVATGYPDVCREHTLLSMMNGFNGIAPFLLRISGGLHPLCKARTIAMIPPGGEPWPSDQMSAPELFGRLARLLEVIKTIHEYGLVHQRITESNLRIKHGDINFIGLMDWSQAEFFIGRSKGRPLKKFPRKIDMLAFVEIVKRAGVDAEELQREVEGLGATDRPDYEIWIRKFREMSEL
jgi:hypothetical protein